METSANTLIIGAGVIGACAAYYLTAAGEAPLLVDRRAVCAGSSYGNAGLIVPSHAFPLAMPGVLAKGARWLLDPESPLYIRLRADPALFRWLVRFATAANEETVAHTVPVLLELSRASLRLYHQLAEEPQIGETIRRRGGLFLCTQHASHRELIHEVEVLQKHGVSAAILDGDAARALAPQATDRVVGGVYFPDDAHLTPDRFVQALAQRAVEHGARLKTGIDVIGFETGGKRITGVMTNRGVIRADQIVLAAGAWSPQLSRDLDLPLDVQPAKGYSITVERPEGFPELPMHLVEGKVVVTPMGETLRFAGTLELAGLDESVNRRRVEAIRRVVPQYLKVDPYAGLVEIWRGLRPLSPDTLPVIGRSRRWENLVIATGHGMLGMSLGPITGQLVAELVTGSPPSLDLTPFRPERMERLLA